MIDDLHRQLAEALRDLLSSLDRQHRDGEPYRQSIRVNLMRHKGHVAVAAYDTALAAESAAREQATAKLMGVDDDGQHGVGA